MRDRLFLWKTPAWLALALVACGGGGAGATGDGGTRAAGDGGTRAAGDGGTIAAGDGGTIASGDGGALPTIAQSALVREPASGVSPTAISDAILANNAFALDLYAHVRASAPAGNLLTSPLSASFALTMAYAGAAGATATQMASALHFGGNAASMFDGQNALSQELAGRAGEALNNDQQAAASGGAPAPSPDDYELQIINSVWGQSAYPWEAPFLDILARSYGTGVHLEDFKHQPDPARLAINAWVSSQTADKIANLLPSGSIDALTRMVLVNAIHLKLPWASAFVANAMPGSFTTASGATVSTSFMKQTLSYSYVDDGQAQIVSMPLAGGYLTVSIALPHGDLATYESGLTTTSAAFQPTGEALVNLSLPKVTFTSPTFSLKTALVAMGMTQAFDKEAADLTGMCANPPDGDNRLYVEDVLQKATLAMQETGVEAAAASAVTVGTTLSASPPEATATMVVNRPFLVAIVDQSGVILFLGHIEDPTQAGSP